MRVAIRRRFAAAVGGLPAVFWTMWWGLIVNRLASFVIAFLSIYLVRERGLRPAEAGRIVALYGAGFTIAGPLGGLLADRIGRRATMVAGLALGALSVAALAFARAPALLASFAFLAAATGDLYRPAMSAAVADVVPPADRPRAYGLVYWAVNLALSVGLFIGGLVAERSFVALFLADAGTSLAAAAIVLCRVPETRPQGIVHEPAVRGLVKVFADGPFLSFVLLHLAALAVFVQWQLALPIDMAAHGLGPSAYAFLMALNCAGVVLLQPILSPRLQRFDAASDARPLGSSVRPRLRRQRGRWKPRRVRHRDRAVDGGRSDGLPGSCDHGGQSRPRCSARPLPGRFRDVLGGRVHHLAVRGR